MRIFAIATTGVLKDDLPCRDTLAWDQRFHAWHPARPSAVRGDATEALLTLVEASDQVEIIAVMELFAFLVFASQEAGSWTGLLVYYITDNQNVEIWLRKRQPRGRVAQTGASLAEA